MRPVAPQLFKGQRLARLVRQTSPGRRMDKQWGEAITSNNRQDRKHHRTITRCTQLLELPPATCSVSKVDMATPMPLIYKTVFPATSTFETPPDSEHERETGA